MASTAMKLHLLLLLSSLALQTRAEIGGSVVFFDASNQKFIRGNSMAIEGEGITLSANEVAASISVLLGSAPVSLSADSSLKLNEVLVANPFDRPEAVFMLEVTGIKDPLSAFSYSNKKIGSAFSIGVLGSSKADIELSGEQEVSRLDEPLNTECDAACIHQELAYLGGTYSGTSEKPMDGELSFPQADGSSLNLHLAKKSDQSFALSLVSLTRNIKKAVENCEVFAESIICPELLLGRFTGIEALEEEYGSGEIVNLGIELLQTAITKLFELLDKSYGGKIVGVVLANRESSVNSGSMLNVMFSSHEPRKLAEVTPFDETTIAEVILVRRTLAWITGIIFLVSTLIGIYYLLYMPLTRDTLLYSNVKFD